MIAKKLDCEDAQAANHRRVDNIENEQFAKRCICEYRLPGHFLRAQLHRFSGLNFGDSLDESQADGTSERADQKHETVVSGRDRAAMTNAEISRESKHPKYIKN